VGRELWEVEGWHAPGLCGSAQLATRAVIGTARSISTWLPPVFLLFRPLISGKCCVESGQRGHFSSLCEKSGAWRPCVSVSPVSTARSARPGTLEEMPMPDTCVCHTLLLLYFSSFYHHSELSTLQSRCSIDEMLPTVPHPPVCASLLRHGLRTRSLTHERLPESAKRAKAYLSRSQGESGCPASSTRSSSSDFLTSSFLLSGNV